MLEDSSKSVTRMLKSPLVTLIVRFGSFRSLFGGRLRIPQGFQLLELIFLYVVKMEMSQTAGFTFQNKLCSPRVSFVLVLRPGETVDIRSMFRNQNKIVEIAFDEFGFILCLYWFTNWTYWWFRRRRFGNLERKGFLLFLSATCSSHLFPYLVAERLTILVKGHIPEISASRPVRGCFRSTLASRARR